MRLAVFTPYFPYPPDTGGKIRSYHFLRALARYFEVDLYVPSHDRDVVESASAALQPFCRRIYPLVLQKSWRTRDRLARVLAPLPRSVDYFFTSQSLAEARELLAAGGYDLLVADEICMTPYAELLPQKPCVVFRQKVDYLHYLEMAQRRSWGIDKVLDWAESGKLHQYEQRKMALYQVAVVCSEEDGAIIQRDAPQIELLVIPNGADLSQFSPVTAPTSDEINLLYVGSMYYYPNIDAVKYFFETCWRAIHQALPQVKVQVVGHAPPPEILRLAELPGVTVTGFVPDVKPYYQGATALIVPLRLGGGTRLKIIEAMAMGVPVISTSVGAEGLAIEPDVNIAIADDAEAFIKQTLRLLQDAELRQKIATGGHLLAQRYDWMALAQPLTELIARLADQ